MTEKEIARKVWDFIDEWERAGDSGLVAGYKKDGYMMAFRRIREELPEILPSPKRKVKKEMWANIHRDEDGDYEVGEIVLYDTKEQADSWCHPGSKLATAKVTFEVEG